MQEKLHDDAKNKIKVILRWMFENCEKVEEEKRYVQSC